MHSHLSPNLFNYYQAVINSSDDAIICKDLSSTVTSWNKAAERMFGYTEAEMIGQPITLLFPADRLGEESLIIERIRAGDRIEHFETVRLHRSGRQIHVSVSISPIQDANGVIVGVSKIARDISEHIQLNQRIDELLSSIKHYQSVVESSDDAIISKDLNGIITSWNRGAELLFGYPASEMIGQNMMRLFPSDKIDEERAILERISNGQRIEHYETERLHQSGKRIHISVTVSPIYNEHGQVTGASKIARNISQRVQEQQQIWFQANHDSLTNLPNRRYFLESLEHAIAGARYEKYPLAVMILDLDDFKLINDAMGHRAGDEVLMATAQCLKANLQEHGFVGRMGGDEFAMYFHHFHHLFEVEVLAKRILAQIGMHALENQHMATTCSIGISIFPNDADHVDELIRQADQALYQAKNSGKQQFKFYSLELESLIQKKKKLMVEIANAIADDQFQLKYQPILNLQTGQIEKCEALLRWQHPTLGDISPLEFIPIAEEANLIGEVTQWIFQQIVKQLTRWILKFGQAFQISINLSPSLLASHELQIFQWLNVLKLHNLPPSNIVVEITEGSMLQNTDTVHSNLRAIKSAGMKIAIDDFGTGYSCLSYLNNLNVDYIKIDRSFVQELGTNPKQTSLCDAIIVMAHQLNLAVIAEGVENPQQLAHLQQTGCDFIQGFWVAEALSAEAFEQRFGHH